MRFRTPYTKQYTALTVFENQIERMVTTASLRLQNGVFRNADGSSDVNVNIGPFTALLVIKNPEG